MNWKNLTLLLFVVICVPAVYGQNPSATDVVSGYVDVDGGKLSYDIVGKGKDIVLIHDGLLPREVWDAQVPALSRTYRVLRYDRRGYGKSPASEKPFSHVEDLHQLMDVLKVSRACLIGMSSGGRLALDFTLKYPDRVDGLVLVGAVVSGLGYTDHFQTRGGHLDPAQLRSMFADTKALAEYWSTDPYETYSGNKDARARMVQLLEANPRELKSAGHESSIPPERPAVRHLSEIKVPALIVVGEHDIPDVHAHAGAIEAGIAGSRRVITPAAGHLVPLEQPEAFNRTVLEFLREKDFMALVTSGKFPEAAEEVETARKKDPAAIPFGESMMNREGYQRLQSGSISEAIEVFRLNVLAYPDSINVYDSLGEAYEKAGRLGLARQQYEIACRKAEARDDSNRAQYCGNLKRLTGTPEQR
jgi:3-oxoadipate enol-lactonase